MVNFKLGDKYDKDEIISVTRAWEKGNWPRSLSVLVAQQIERPAGVRSRKVMISIPVGDSDFFFFPLSCHVDYFIFIIFLTELKIYHLFFYLFIIYPEDILADKLHLPLRSP